jgi:hypothetical protein
MKTLGPILWLVLALGAGCDLKPAPAGSGVAKTEPAATPPTPAAPTGDTPPPPPQGAPQPTPPMPVDAGVAAVPPDAVPAPPPDIAVTDECVSIGDKIAGIIIESTQDPTTKAAIEQDRTKFVRRMAEACTTSPWPAEAKACFVAAKTADEVQVCGAKLTGQQ